MNIPADASSLLVPVHLDAWVVDPQNQEKLAWYYANMNNLNNFQSIMPDVFDYSDVSKHTGIHLHWALPDALTRGSDTKSKQAGSVIQFPFVPNRWVVVRLNTSVTAGEKDWVSKLWVVESDFLGSIAGTTAAQVSGPNVNSITLGGPLSIAIASGEPVELIAPDMSYQETVYLSAAAKTGDTQLQIIPKTFINTYPSGSTLQLASSSFLNPFVPTTMQAEPGQPTVFTINDQNLGRHHDINHWESSENAASAPFLTATGPGNISFSAYVPMVKDVFSFNDVSLPDIGGGIIYNYTYLVVGWYADADQNDPLRGVNTFIEGIWPSRQVWQEQSVQERFKTLLDYYKWTADTTQNTNTPPATTLYHGCVVDVQWPPPAENKSIKDDRDFYVGVANNSTDALATLIMAKAKTNASDHPDKAAAWISAGDTLASLVQASMYDLLPEYDQPGGEALIDQKIEDAWFGSKPGGTVWTVKAKSPQAAGQGAAGNALTSSQQDELNTQLSELNKMQRSFDGLLRQLKQEQSNLYLLWIKIGRAHSFGWGMTPETIPDFTSILLPQIIEEQAYPGTFEQVWNEYCQVQQAAGRLPNPNDETLANAWANQNWVFHSDAGDKTTLADLGLVLHSNPVPRFYHPQDPVIIVSGINRSRKHGEDGRYNKDGSLTCRMPGQTITGIRVPGQPEITVSSITAGGINLMPFGPYTSIPVIDTLVHETFFTDPLNAPLMAKAVQGDSGTISAAIHSLIGQASGATAAWQGNAPAPFGIQLWTQAWAPLFLEWSLMYFPTGTNSTFNSSDWSFDGDRYNWNGTGYSQNNAQGYKGRCVITPHASYLFKDRIQKYLKGHPAIDNEQLDSLLDTIAGWDILSQSLSGFSQQLITLLSQEAFPPTVSGTPVQCLAPGAQKPAVGDLIGEEYHYLPVFDGSAFYPVRGGFIQLQQLQIVDSYGQVKTLSDPNTQQGFIPEISKDLQPSVNPANWPYGMIQLAPRIIQDTRLNMQLLSNDHSGGDIITSANPNPVCGWILPNHLDGSLAVYDSFGEMLGELFPLQAPDNWRPRPGKAGVLPPPQSPSQIQNEALRSVIVSLSGQAPDTIADFIKVIDSTLWMTDPMGGRKDQYLSVLIGRPLAVAQLSLNFELNGTPSYNQVWNSMSVQKPDGTYVWNKDTGDLLTTSFPIRMGNLELRNDGLIGYFLTSKNEEYKQFYTVHQSEAAKSGDTYLCPIIKDNVYQGNLSLTMGEAPVTITTIIDPRGCVHASTGILPVTQADLPANLVEDFISKLNVTFQTGPVIADPGTLRIPKPDEKGNWVWIEASGAAWEEDQIVDANDKARLADDQLTLREGWLKLSDIQDKNR